MRNLKRFYAVAIAIAMLVGMLAPAATFAAETKTDYAADAKLLYDLKLYKGLSDKEYQPDLDSTLNRQTAATMVLRLVGEEEAALKMDEKEARSILAKKFKDADQVDAWAVKQVATLVDQGVINGFQDKTFQPKGMLTGRQFCTMLLRKLDYTDFTFENAGKKFAEISGLSAAQQTAFDVNSAIKKDVLAGIARKSLEAKREGSKNETLLQELVRTGTLKEADVVKVIPDFKPPVVTTTPSGTPNGTPSTTPTTSVNGATYGSVEVVNDLVASNLIVGSTLNKVFKFKVTAPANEDLNISSLMASEFGTAAGSTTDIQRVYLMDGETVLVAGSLNNGEARLNKSVTIAKGTNKTYVLAVDINSASTGATRTVIVGFASSAAITSTPAITPFTTAMQGATYTIISASVGAINTITAGTNAGGTIKVGETGKDLGDFTITPTSTEDIKLTNLTLTVSGLNLAHLDNLYLYDDTFTKIDVKGTVDGTRLLFNLGEKAVLIGKSNAKKFYLKGDVIMGSSSNVSGRFKIQNNYDVIAKGMNSGVNVTVPSTAAPKDLSTADITVGAGSVSLTDTSNVPTKVVMTSSYKGMIREWLVTAPGEMMNIDRVDMTITPSALNDLDAELGSFYLTDDKGNVLSGPVTCPTTVAAANNISTHLGTVTFSDVNYTIPANGSLKFQLRATLTDDSINGTFGMDAQIAVNGFDYTLQTTNTVMTSFPTTASPSSYVTKDIVTGSTVTVTKDESFVTVSRPIGSKNTTIGKWLFASTDDKSKITKIKVSTAATLVSNISNMKLYVDGVQKGATCSTATAASNSYFEVDLTSDPLYIDAGVTKQLDFKADIDSTTNDGYDFVIVASDMTAFSVQTNVAASKTGVIKANHLYVTTSGTLGKTAPISEQVLDSKQLGDVEVELVRARFTAANEAIALNQIELTGIMVNSANTRAVKNVKVYDLANPTTPLATLAAFTIGGKHDGTTTAIPMANLEIASASNKVVVVKGELDKSSFVSGEQVKFGVYSTGSGSTATKGKGVLSQRDCYVGNAAATWGGTLTQVDAKAVVTVDADSPSGNATSSTIMPFLKFTVKAVGGDIYITPSVIAITTGGTAGIVFGDDVIKMYKVNSDGTETAVASLDGTAGPVQVANMMINDTSGAALVSNGDYAIAKDTSVTFIVRNASGTLQAIASNATLSLTLSNLRISDAPSQPTANNPTEVWVGDGGTGNQPVISGNALKF